MTPQDTVVERIRALLGDTVLREVSMFGGRSLMVSGKMIVSVQKDGDLLVRVDPARDARLVTHPGASRAVMGADRAMGVGWVAVTSESIVDDAALSTWVTVALEYNRAVTSGS